MYKIALIPASINDSMGGAFSSHGSLSLVALKTYADINLSVPADIRIFDDVESIVRFAPHMVGISSNTPLFNVAKDIAKNIKLNTSALVVLGGYHITFLPEEIKHDCFDIGVVGEGEKTFTKLIEAAWNNTPYDEIKGLVYKKDGVIMTTPPQELLAVEEIPIPMGGRVASIVGFEAVFSARGCPYCCKFCSQIKFWRGKTRCFSAETVVLDIRCLHENFGAKYIVFTDDLFIYPIERLRSIVSLLEKEDLLSKIHFDGAIRANLVNDEVMNLLKRMNVRRVSFGAESGSDLILKKYKPSTSVDINQRCIDLCLSYGFLTTVSFIVGFPGETKDDLLQTAAFIRRNTDKYSKGFSPAVTVCQCFPGTDAWDELCESVKRDIILNQQWDKMKLGFYQDSAGAENQLYFNEDIIPRNEFLELVNKSFDKKVLYPNWSSKPIPDYVKKIASWGKFKK